MFRRASLPQGVVALIAEASNPVVVVDAHGIIVAANAEAYGEFGWQLGSLKGNPVEVLLPERYRRGHVGLRDAFLAAPETRTTRPMGLDRHIYACRRDGSECAVEVHLIPVAGRGNFVMAHLRPVETTA